MLLLQHKHENILGFLSAFTEDWVLRLPRCLTLILNSGKSTSKRTEKRAKAHIQNFIKNLWRLRVPLSFDINTGLQKGDIVTVPHKLTITHSNARTFRMLLLLNLIIFFFSFCFLWYEKFPPNFCCWQCQQISEIKERKISFVVIR